MSALLIVVVTILYLGVTVAFMFEGKPGMALCFAGYSLANLGLLWASRTA